MWTGVLAGVEKTLTLGLIISGALAVIGWLRQIWREQPMIEAWFEDFEGLSYLRVQAYNRAPVAIEVVSIEVTEPGVYLVSRDPKAVKISQTLMPCAPGAPEFPSYSGGFIILADQKVSSLSFILKMRSRNKWIWSRAMKASIERQATNTAQ